MKLRYEGERLVEKSVEFCGHDVIVRLEFAEVTNIWGKK